MGETKKKFLGFLANIGLAEEVPDGPAPKPSGGPPRNTPLPPAPSHVQSAAADPEVLARLEARLQKNCPEPYLSFMEQYENLKEVIPDEAMRFKAALKASHTTASQLVDALGQLVGVMDAASAEFSHDYEQNRTRQLGEAEASLKATDDLIASNEQQLKALQDTIATLHTKRQTDAQAMADKAQKIETVRASFEAAHRQVVGRLQAQKTRVEGMSR
jgi:chromosome segregation ATPase